MYRNLYTNFQLICILCAIHQVPLVDLQLRIASCVLRVTTATRVEKLSQVVSVQKATSVLRDRALSDHNNMSAQWDITVRRSNIQYWSLSYCQSWLLNIGCAVSAESATSLHPQMWFSFCHKKCITALFFLTASVFFLFCVCLSLHCYCCTMIMSDDACYSLDIKSNKFNGCSRGVSDRQPAFPGATSSDKARAAARLALLVSIVKIKVKL